MSEYIGNHLELYGFIGWPDVPADDIDPEFDASSASWEDEEWRNEDD